jgi:hypothetical protein
MTKPITTPPKPSGTQRKKPHTAFGGSFDPNDEKNFPKFRKICTTGIRRDSHKTKGQRAVTTHY